MHTSPQVVAEMEDLFGLSLLIGMNTRDPFPFSYVPPVIGFFFL